MDQESTRLNPLNGKPLGRRRKVAARPAPPAFAGERMKELPGGQRCISMVARIGRTLERHADCSPLVRP